MKQMERLYNLRFIDACIIENNMWLMNMNYSGLFKIDLDCYKIEYISCIYDNDQIKQRYLSRNIINRNNTLWLFPYNGNDIVEYDIESNHMKYYTSTSTSFINDDSRVNHWTVIYKEQAWIFPQILSNPQIPLHIFDLSKKEFIEHMTWNRILSEHNIYGDDHSITSIFHKDEWVWIVVSGINYLISYNLDNFEMRLYNIGKNIMLQSVNHDENSFWLLTKNESKLLEWDIDRGIINQYDLKQDKHNAEEFSNIAVVQDKIIVLPRRGMEIVVLEKGNRKLTTLDSFPEGFRRIEGMEMSSLIYGWKIYNSKLLLLPWSGNMLLELDLQTYELKGHTVEISESTYKESYVFPKMGIYPDKGIFPNMRTRGIMESEHFSLEDYLYMVGKVEDLTKPLIEKESIECGKSIYEYTKELI